MSVSRSFYGKQEVHTITNLERGSVISKQTRISLNKTLDLREVFLHKSPDYAEDRFLVLLVDESIMENTKTFVPPKPNEVFKFGKALWSRDAKALGQKSSGYVLFYS